MGFSNADQYAIDDKWWPIVVTLGLVNESDGHLTPEGYMMMRALRQARDRMREVEVEALNCYVRNKNEQDYRREKA